MAYSASPWAIKVAANGMDTIVVAPHIYDGHVYRYTRSNQRWVMEKLKGCTLADPSYFTVTKKEIDTSEDVRRGAIMASSPSGPQRARILSRSYGIGILSTGHILNFTLWTPLKQDSEPFAELYGQDGILKAYGRLVFDDPELNGSAQVMDSISLQWIDAADRLYIARRNLDGSFTLSVAELEITPL